MRTLGLIEPLMLIIAGFSKHQMLLEQSESRLVELFGPIALNGPIIEFRNTSYYDATMGTGLLKRYWAFARLQEPDQLAQVKRLTIELEQEMILSHVYPEKRPLNLDPGFLSMGKFVLATTKDQAHRIYLHGGIFAEVTLRFHDGEFEPRPWTYPDWQLPQVLEFLKDARHYYHQHKDNSSRSISLMPRLLIRDTSHL